MKNSRCHQITKFRNVLSLPNNSTDKEVRLVDGVSTYEGRVEVYHAGQWGTVCNDGWDDVDAEVVCNSLGLLGGVAVTNPNYAPFGQGSDPIWMDDVACTASNTNLKSCNHNGWGVEDCEHSGDAGVKCGKLSRSD